MHTCAPVMTTLLKVAMDLALPLLGPLSAPIVARCSSCGSVVRCGLGRLLKSNRPGYQLLIMFLVEAYSCNDATPRSRGLRTMDTDRCRR